MIADSGRSSAPSRSRRHAFVDEYGNSNLDGELANVGHFYLVTAILLDGASVSAVRSQVDAIRAKHFQSGEMKSSKVGSNDRRRCAVLKELDALPFTFVSLVVDKRRLRDDGGFIYKKPFIKFLHRQLFQKLFGAHRDLVLLSDQHGRPEFMEGFKRYVRKHLEPDLFLTPEFGFGVSEKEPLLQLADFVGGSVARFYEPSMRSEHEADFRKLLGTHATLVFSWPPHPRPLSSLGESGTPADREVRNSCLNEVFSFLAKHQASACGEEVAAQLAVAEYLLFHLQSIDEASYVSTVRLRRHLVEQGIVGFDKQREFRSRIIAGLRDKGVLLASSGRGYKIPISIRDLMDFVDRIDTVAFPMLGRLQRARERVLLLTSGAVDIIGEARFDYLRGLLDRGPFVREIEQSKAVAPSPE